MNRQLSAMVRAARPEDIRAVVQLLEKEKLPTEDLDKNLSHFFLVEDGSALIGVIGLEVYQSEGLLRSLAVDPAHRKRSIASLLIQELLAYCKEINISTLYLITTTAEDYFRKKGFATISRNEVPATIQSSREFSSLCPSTATVMITPVP